MDTIYFNHTHSTLLSSTSSSAALSLNPLFPIYCLFFSCVFVCWFLVNYWVSQGLLPRPWMLSYLLKCGPFTNFYTTEENNTSTSRNNCQDHYVFILLLEWFLWCSGYVLNSSPSVSLVYHNCLSSTLRPIIFLRLLSYQSRWNTLDVELLTGCCILCQCSSSCRKLRFL